jgi:hypothetical protein
MQNTSNRWALEQGILNQAFAERGKLRELRRDPRAVLEQALGQSLPDEVKVKVAFDKPKTIHQVVPHEGHALLGSIEPPTGSDAIKGLRGLAAATAHRAATDPVFRAKLVSDAKGLAKSGLSKLEVPDELEIVVLQEDPNTIWLTVPLVGRPNVRTTRRAGGKPDDKPRRK